MPHPETQEVLWFRPDPRAILPLDGFHVSQSLKKTLKKVDLTISTDRAFATVMQRCSEREGEGTWINDEFLAAYTALHQEGNAHSLEVWHGKTLVGGVYGVCLGGAFFAESMFHRETDASKVALYHLTEKLKAMNFDLLETQFMTPHLKSLGAVEISGDEYIKRLKRALKKKTVGSWKEW